MNEYREAPLPIDPSLVAMLGRRREKTHWKEVTDWVLASPYFDGASPTVRVMWLKITFGRRGKRLVSVGGWRTYRRTYQFIA
jgi:hypothetical protein